MKTAVKSISFSDRNKEKNNEHEREIVRTAYQSIPNEFLETLIVLMMQHNYQPRTFYPNQIFNRLTENYQPTTEAEKQRVVTAAVEQVKQNPTLKKRLKAGGQAFIFEALQKASDQWWVAPFVKAIEAGVKGE